MEQFLTYEFPPEVRNWAVVVFFWTGYASIVGLVVAAIIPYRDLRSPWAVFSLGWIGAALGPLVARPFAPSGKFDPVSPFGFLVAIGFSTLAVLAYCVFSFLFPKREEEDDDGRDDERV